MMAQSTLVEEFVVALRPPIVPLMYERLLLCAAYLLGSPFLECYIRSRSHARQAVGVLTLAHSQISLTLQLNNRIQASRKSSGLDTSIPCSTPLGSTRLVTQTIGSRLPAAILSARSFAEELSSVLDQASTHTVVVRTVDAPREIFEILRHANWTVHVRQSSLVIFLTIWPSWACADVPVEALSVHRFATYVTEMAPTVANDVVAGVLSMDFALAERAQLVGLSTLGSIGHRLAVFLRRVLLVLAAVLEDVGKWCVLVELSCTNHAIGAFAGKTRADSDGIGATS